MSFFRYVGVTIGTIVFARDDLVSSSRKQQHIAQHLNEFRQAPELTLKWSELCFVAVKTKMKARAKMMAVRLNAASVKSGII